VDEPPRFVLTTVRRATLLAPLHHWRSSAMSCGRASAVPVAVLGAPSANAVRGAGLDEVDDDPLEPRHRGRVDDRLEPPLELVLVDQALAKARGESARARSSWLPSGC
jgi:hypothetical protein